MDKHTRDAAIAANLSALRRTLEAALLRACEAEGDFDSREINQAIGSVLGIDALMDDARALFTAVIALHRGR